MIITLKTLQQVTFKIEIDPSKTVKELKAQIEETHGQKDYNASNQKLIYSGKILEDDKPLSEYNIDEKKFIVLMMTRPPPAPKPAAAPAASSSTPAKSADTKPSEAPAAPKKEPVSGQSDKSSAKKEPTSDPVEASSSLSASTAESNLVTGEAYKQMVKQMCDMGYTKKQVERALRASFNNPDRAVEYLVNGLPPEMLARDAERAARRAAATASEASSRSPEGAARPSSVTSGASTGHGAAQASADVAAQGWDMIRNQPQFRTMQQIIQQNPHLLSHAIEGLAETNPELYSLVSEHPDAFLAALQEPPSQGGGPPLLSSQPAELATPAEPQSAAAQAAAAAEVGQAGQEENPDFYNRASQQDKDAIERLKSLGFPEYLVIQAYMACNRDEQLAANLLLQMGD